MLQVGPDAIARNSSYYEMQLSPATMSSPKIDQMTRFAFLVFIGGFYREENQDGSTARQLPVLRPGRAYRSHQRLLTFLKVVIHFTDM